MAEKFPNAQITALSNSAPQREHIMARALERKLTNITVLTQNVAVFEPASGKGAFDRVVSIEMFEHSRQSKTFFAYHPCPLVMMSSAPTRTLRITHTPLYTTTQT